jgi:hypothetical protein
LIAWDTLNRYAPRGICLDITSRLARVGDNAFTGDITPTTVFGRSIDTIAEGKFFISDPITVVI